METGIIIMLALVVIYTLLGYALARVWITMPMFFLIAGAILGPHGLGWISFGWDTSNVEVLTEMTLAFLLFADAASLDFDQVKEDAKLPGRLLLIGFPLTVLMGALVAYLLFPAEKIGFALLVGAILAPTDAALGLPIFNNPRVPVRVRRALNVESGLNDGLATPLVTLFIVLALEELEGGGHGQWAFLAVSEIAIAVGVGITLGLVGGWFFAQAVRKNWSSTVARQIGNPALALLVFFAARHLGGNGFVAVFVGGILFGYITRHVLHEDIEYTEITGTFLSLFVWTIFGAAIAIPLLQDFTPLALLYAILSLTVVRMIPMAIALIGTRLRKDTILMMGWLGPRGLASVVFLIMAYEAAHEAQIEVNLLLATVGWTIVLSVLLHGASALPLANWYGHRLESASANIPEMLEVTEPKTLRRKAFHIDFTNHAK
ncbi:MAG: cation:proton antiporter [Anaerolineales bacterium]